MSQVGEDDGGCDLFCLAVGRGFGWVQNYADAEFVGGAFETDGDHGGMVGE